MTFEDFMYKFHYDLGMKNPETTKIQREAIKKYNLSTEDLYKIYKAGKNLWGELYLTLDILYTEVYEKQIVKGNLNLPKPYSLVVDKDNKFYYKDPVFRLKEKGFADYAKHCADTVSPKIQEELDLFFSKDK